MDEDAILVKNPSTGQGKAQTTKKGAEYRIADFRFSCILLVSDDGREIGWLQNAGNSTLNSYITRRGYPADILYPNGSIVDILDQVDILAGCFTLKYHAQLRAYEAHKRTAFYKESGLLMEDLENMTMSQLRDLWRRFGLSTKHLDSRDKYREDARDMLEHMIGLLMVHKIDKGRVVLRCTNLAGSQLAELLCIDAGITGQQVLMKVADQSGIPAERLELVLPNCEVLQRSNKDISQELGIKM